MKLLIEEQNREYSKFRDCEGNPIMFTYSEKRIDITMREFKLWMLMRETIPNYTPYPPTEVVLGGTDENKTE
jgi:hypothetical protein